MSFGRKDRTPVEDTSDADLHKPEGVLQSVIDDNLVSSLVT